MTAMFDAEGNPVLRSVTMRGDDQCELCSNDVETVSIDHRRVTFHLLDGSVEISYVGGYIAVIEDPRVTQHTEHSVAQVSRIEAMRFGSAVTMITDPNASARCSITLLERMRRERQRNRSLLRRSLEALRGSGNIIPANEIEQALESELP